MKNITKLNKLELLANEIESGTYNVESSEITHADTGYMLTMEILTDNEEVIDFIALSDIINYYDCIIILIAAKENKVVFSIEEKLESGH